MFRDVLHVCFKISFTSIFEIKLTPLVLHKVLFSIPLWDSYILVLQPALIKFTFTEGFKYFLRQVLSEISFVVDAVATATPQLRQRPRLRQRPQPRRGRAANPPKLALRDLSWKFSDVFGHFGHFLTFSSVFKRFHSFSSVFEHWIWLSENTGHESSARIDSST